MGKPYTTREAKKIVDMWIACEDVGEICKETGRGEFSVRSFVRRQRGLQGSDKIPFARDRNWGKGYFEIMVDMWNAGATMGDIARKLGKTTQEIKDKITCSRRKDGEKYFPRRKTRS